MKAHAVGLRRYRPLVVGLEDKGNILPELQGRLLAKHPLAVRLGWMSALAERLRPERPALIHAHFATDGLHRPAARRGARSAAGDDPARL